MKTRGKNIDVNSPENQMIKERIFSKEIYANVTDLIDDLLTLSEKCHDSDLRWKITNFANYKRDEDGDYPEITQWYIVSHWLGVRLKKKGEVILDRFMGPIWGCSEFYMYNIIYGTVFSEIALDLGILVGDENVDSKI